MAFVLILHYAVVREYLAAKVSVFTGNKKKSGHVFEIETSCQDRLKEDLDTVTLTEVE